MHADDARRRLLARVLTGGAFSLNCSPARATALSPHWPSDPAPTFLADPPGASLTAPRVRLAALPPRRVGLLGGSFNPAHSGHRHVSLEALKRLDLDEVWWLVAPQNPLKPARGMAPYRKRLDAAAKLAADRRIRVLNLEAQLGTLYTADTLDALRRRFPRTRFVWLMGADNLAQIRHWRRWTDIFDRVPIAVFARPTYCLKGLAELAAKRYAHQRAAPEAARRLAELAPPVWAFLPIRLDTSSATDIRSHRAPRRKPRGKGKGRRPPGKRR
ncbi:MAG TPA: nicotinate-nucleotide adenylyltransferase [Stellaceae bacterium]|nr:nicotinate-nucleotide adenylyltransferase [Stellaceae bacterium]